MDNNIVTECYNCGGERNHNPLHIKKVVPSLTDEGPYGDPEKEIFEYMLLQCKGCNAVSFLIRQKTLATSENTAEEVEFYDQNFPEPDLFDDDDNGFLVEEDRKKLPKKVLALYEEVEFAFEEEANMLAGVGLRMLVESICLDQNISGNNLQIKITKLHDAGYIAKNDVPILDILRDIGNVSAHEIKGFPMKHLSYALDIIDHILKSIYVMPDIQKKLQIKK